MAKRMIVSEEEAAILEGLRHEKAIWNQALEAVLLLLNAENHSGDLDRVSGDIIITGLISKVMELRKQ